MNELSNTIDLQSTLIRAEQLFRRFQKTVEALDKSNNFPVPEGATMRQRRLGPSSPQGPQVKISKEDEDRAKKAVESAGMSGVAVRSPRRKSAAASSSAAPAAGAQTSSPQGATPSSAETAEEERAEIKVISLELRRLLSRDPPKMNKQQVKKHGGGVGS